MIHNDPMDLYRALGLTSSATMEEIGAAFRKRAKETHPDSTGQASADAFREMSDAYDILGDPVRRQEYDRVARELYEEQQGGREAVRLSEPWSARPSARRTTRWPIRAIARVLTLLVGCALLVWAAIDMNDERNAEIALIHEREVDIERRFPTCASPPFAGTILGVEAQNAGSYTVLLENSSLYNIIAKVRDVNSGQVVVSFYIPRGRLVSYDYLSEKNYKIQYAFGTKLDVECRNLIEPVAISENFMDFDKSGSDRIIYYRFDYLPRDYPADYGRHSRPAIYYVRVPLREFLKP
ncbi:J domain-containing protein [Pleomorphomonas oryzae]|uniref:J domain-containing protein n=1 Tax=Pleomorphomonas oryzae TaxID=261934 RepID=UPI000687DF1C|nr:J domain-containing protein [Pleomorphomonas oryzae]